MVATSSSFITQPQPRPPIVMDRQPATGAKRLGCLRRHASGRSLGARNAAGGGVVRRGTSVTRHEASAKTRWPRRGPGRSRSGAVYDDLIRQGEPSRVRCRLLHVGELSADGADREARFSTSASSWPDAVVTPAWLPRPGVNLGPTDPLAVAQEDTQPPSYCQAVSDDSDVRSQTRGELFRLSHPGCVWVVLSLCGSGWWGRAGSKGRAGAW